MIQKANKVFKLKFNELNKTFKPRFINIDIKKECNFNKKEISKG